LFFNQKEFQVFLSNNTATPVNLSEYTLHISLQEEGSTGNKLKYQDFDQQKHAESSIEQPISHFVQQDVLEKNNPITIPFELMTTPGTVQITIQVSLEHADRNIHIDPIVIVWKGVLNGFPPVTPLKQETSPAIELNKEPEQIDVTELPSLDYMKKKLHEMGQDTEKQKQFELKLKKDLEGWLRDQFPKDPPQYVLVEDWNRRQHQTFVQYKNNF